MSSATRWGGLRPDPYNPDAFDADGDGIVQEGTAFERPAGMRIVDEFGRELRTGFTSETRPSNWRIVDKDGNTVDYVPTYQRTPSQPVSNFVGTVGGMVGTVRDRVGTVGDRISTLDKVTGTIISLADIERATAPEGLSEATRDLWTAAKEQSLKKRKNAAVLRLEGAEADTTIEDIRPFEYFYLETSDQDPDEVKALLRPLVEQLYVHDGLGADGRFYTRYSYGRTKPYWDAPLGKEYDILDAGVEFVDSETGEVIGSFYASFPKGEYGEVEHDLIRIDEEYQGLGIVQDFLTSTERMYYLSGIKSITGLAALQSGPYMWARDGFDWENEYEKERFLYTLRDNVSLALRSGGLTNETANEYFSLIDRAFSENGDDPERITPLHFSFMPQYGELTRTMNWRMKRDVRPIGTTASTDEQYDVADSGRQGLGEERARLLAERRQRQEARLREVEERNRERIARYEEARRRAAERDAILEAHFASLRQEQTDSLPEYEEVTDGPQDYNLPLREGQVLPDEMLQPPNMEKVSELISAVDGAQQIVPRAIASAFYQNDFSWLADQFAFDAGGYAHLGGDAQPVEGLSLADMAYVMSVFREDAQASVRRVADENGMVRVFRGGPISQTDEPVSVSLDRSEAEQFGEVYEYLVPVEAFEYQPPTGSSYADEYLVNPNMMQQQNQNDENITQTSSEPELLDAQTNDLISEKIKARNKEILDGIRESGGTDFARPTPEFLDKINVGRTYSQRGFDNPEPGYESHIFPAIPRQSEYDAAESRRERARLFLTSLKKVLEEYGDEEPDWESSKYAGRRGSITPRKSKYGMQPSDWHAVRHGSPELLAMIKEKSVDELLEIMEEQAAKFIDPDLEIRVRTDAERLESILKDGRFRTIFEVESRVIDGARVSAPTESRIFLEERLGLPADTPPEFRPASGYVVHPDWIAKAVEDFKAAHEGREPTENDDLPLLAGPLWGYGEVEIKLRPEVKGRSSFGRGDSFNGQVDQVRFDETDPAVIANALITGQGRDADEFNISAIRMLESATIGDFSDINVVSRSPGEGFTQSDVYFEALIPGGFNLEEIEEVVMPLRIATEFDMDAVSKDLTAEFFATDKLRAMGLSEEEIAYVLQKMSETEYGRSPIANVSSAWVSGVLKVQEFRAARARRDALAEAGIPLRVTDPGSRRKSGIDIFDPVAYGGKPDDDVEKILIDRATKDIVRQIRESMERELNSSESEDMMFG